MSDTNTILVTGSAGFIGANLVKRIFKDYDGATVIGLDNMNDYYDVALKEHRLEDIELARKNSTCSYKFYKGDLADKALITRIFEEHKPDIAVNLAAQAGVRYSIENPDAYINSNIIGFYNILEACRRNPVKHLVYASSSSVYGGNEKIFYPPEKLDGTGATRKFRSAPTTWSITPFRSTPRPKRATSFWLIPTRSSTISPRRVCAFSPFTVPQAVRIWLISASQTSL